MRFIGSIESLCGRRLLIVRCDAANLPPLNIEVVDRRLTPVGRLIEVFGNVLAPYAAVACYGQCNRKAGEKLYAK